MKFKGKTAFWFWGVFVLVNAVFIQDILLAESMPTVKIVSLIIFNALFLPMVLRNYVKIEDDTLYVAFGFSKNSMKISDITEVNMMINPASAITAQDRIVIKGGESELYCTVKDREGLLEELRSRRPDLEIRRGITY